MLHLDDLVKGRYFTILRYPRRRKRPRLDSSGDVAPNQFANDERVLQDGVGELLTVVGVVAPYVVAESAIDRESYLVDVRECYLVPLAGEDGDSISREQEEVAKPNQ